MTSHPAAPPSSTPVLRRVLLWGTALTILIAVGGAVVGVVVSAGPGLVGGLLGGLIAAVFLGVTAASILVANRFTASPLYTSLFFAIVLGAWLIKFVLFIVVLSLLRNQPWLDPIVLLLTLIVAVIGNLVIDVVVVAKNRMPYVSDVALPGEQSHPKGGPDDSSRSRQP